jgi:hypothetical protein
LPPLPSDAKGSQWPGSGGTLYSKGGRSTRMQLEAIAEGLGLINRSSNLQEEDSGNWWERLLPKSSSRDSQYNETVNKGSLERLIEE